MSRLKIAMIQMRVDFNEPSKNLERAEQFIGEAAKAKAQICILPECLDIGWGNPKALELGEPIPGKISEAYCEMAKKYHIFLVAGLTETCSEKVYNAAILISDMGEVLLHHRKINVLTGVEDVYEIGNSLGVADTALGKIGIDICADNSANSTVLAHSLARMGAQIILSPCSWAVRPDRDVEKEPYGNEWFVPYKQLASLYHMPIIGVSNVGNVEDGSWKGWKAIGNSIAVDSNGEVLAVLPYGESAQVMEIVEVTLLDDRKKGTSLSEEISNKLFE